MEKNWNFNEITKEIERIKNWKPQCESEKIEKYLALKEYEDMLFARTANDRGLESQHGIKKSMSIAGKYVNRKKGLDKKIKKEKDEYIQQMLINYLELTKNHSIDNNVLDINSPINNRYVNNLSIENLAKIGDGILSSIPFMEENGISKMIDKGLLSLTDSDKTIYSPNLAKSYSTGHMLSTYDENINLKTLINILSSYAKNTDINLGEGYHTKKLNNNHMFASFLPKITELLSLDSIAENNESFATDINLFKNKILNKYNMHLNNLMPLDYKNEDIDYLIEFVSEELLASKNSTKLKEIREKIKNPSLFLPQIYGGFKNISPSVVLSEDILCSGRDILGTLLAMKFYYLIKEDKEKGMWILNLITRSLVTNKNTNILNHYCLDDYLSPDYIQQYNNDYKLEQKVIRKSLK